MKTAAIALFALLLTACAPRAPEPKGVVKQYAMRGEVVQLDPENKVATIKHESIEGFMGAMTMEYGFRDQQEFAKLHKGDHFDATLFVQGDEYWVGAVKPAAPEAPK